MFHVCTNLMSTSCLKDTFDECCITKTFNDTIVCNCRLTNL